MKYDLLKRIWIIYLLFLTGCHPETKVDVLIIGGGASGLCSAICAARNLCTDGKQYVDPGRT